ncbi:TetR family transcriptional regulator C-terminal domain-containing protein [Kineosporia sp. J2-2]|uniref:TetR family transcriptional regulator C-terminal domain-containing protein n=1 Tax=Kineosporia corallincola TaxID=2835133 RepID=A0ABS5T9P9_9ACTN|nr:TetR family transcriptional regulator C-terminal domain-containing protein [Kineosporia corallincola]MBT0767800.1 TetR family transcriptional regulator C-terminal domain-containing protein [Kineosporia corallincola]
MARQQAEIRREEILRAAATVVSRKGFARTRVADVAAELGISAGLVFYHFDSKERLLSEAFVLASERDLDTVDAAVAGPGTHVERLRNVIRLHQQISSDTSDLDAWPRNIDAWAEGRWTEEIREVARRNDERWRNALTRLITSGVEAGEFRSADPQETALRICVMLDGLAVATQVRGTLSRGRARAWADECAARELGLPSPMLPPAQR